ncbi:hypothetical protein ACS126_19005, partial [Sphingobacterium lactis]|uniref:hypothetical protein n=1 Tax=Sphingobacterium lactis TaxID=797291 RepID=UPI003EC7EB4F
ALIGTVIYVRLHARDNSFKDAKLGNFYYSPQEFSLIHYNFNGKRYKEYTGKKLGLHIFPNSAKTLKSKESF